ncbi:MAG: tetratricopeptide repeat protein [bacterium]|nr:tetratricopeptide repeat protein [bacterium]
MIRQLHQPAPVLVIIVIFVIAMMFFLRSGDNLFTLLNDPVGLVQKGNYYFNVGGNGGYDLKKAEKYFNKALEIDPAVPDAWHQLARIDFLRGNFPGALQKINKQIELHGDSLMSAYYIRGLIYGYTKEYEKAEQDFLKFLEWDKTNWAIYNDLAWIYFQQGNYEKTLKTAEAGLAYHLNNPWLLNMAGISSLNLGDMDNAHAYLEKAILWTETLTEADWHKAYPGNDPRVAGQGIKEMKEAIRANLNLLAPLEVSL